MKPFQQYANEKQLQESSLSRIFSRVQDHRTGALSAFRDQYTKAENKDRNKSMMAWLLKRGYSVTKVKGSFIEQFGKSNATEVGEESLFVANIQVDGDDGGQLEKDLIKIGRYFDQDSVLSVQVGGDKAELIGTSHRDDAFPSYGQRENVGSLKMGKANGPFFSRVHGRQFAFEAEDVLLPGSIGGKQAMYKIAERIDSEIEE